MRRLFALAVVAGCAGAQPVGDGGASCQSCDAPANIAASPLYAHTATALYRIESDNGFEAALVGGFGLPCQTDITGCGLAPDATDRECMTDLAVAPDGTIYTTSFARLYTIDPQNAQPTLVAELLPAPAQTFNGLTFLGDGRLWAVNSDGEISTVDRATAAITASGAFGPPYGSSGDLVAIADGTLFGISQLPDPSARDNNLLLTVAESGMASSVGGGIGFGRVYGLAYTLGKVYAFTCVGEIIEIDPRSGQGRLVRRHEGIYFWGAGITPL